jgi:hypothetical protein
MTEYDNAKNLEAFRLADAARRCTKGADRLGPRPTYFRPSAALSTNRTASGGVRIAEPPASLTPTMEEPSG